MGHPTGENIENAVAHHRDDRIIVSVRIRPPIPTQENSATTMVAPESKSGKMNQNRLLKVSSAEGYIQVLNQPKPKMFHFDHVFGPSALQQDVYSAVAQPLIADLPGGINACIMAYGQTGSGKTFTLSELNATSSDDAGILPRAIRDLFRVIEQERVQFDHTIKLSYLQIYMEVVCSWFVGWQKFFSRLIYFITLDSRSVESR